MAMETPKFVLLPMLIKQTSNTNIHNRSQGNDKGHPGNPSRVSQHCLGLFGLITSGQFVNVILKTNQDIGS